MVLLFYVFVSSFGALSYGNSLRDSIINSLQTQWLQQAANLMIAAHCLLVITLYINPLNQEVEDWFKIPQGIHFRNLNFNLKNTILC